MRSVTFTFEYPPIPVRTCDWRATWSTDDENGPSGWGATKKEAFLDLLILTETEREPIMAQYYLDTTWEVMTVNGSLAVVELDVRVHYDIMGRSAEGPIDVKDVKALFRKHGTWIELDIPEELRVLAVKHFDASIDFAEAVDEARQEHLCDDAADAKADHIRERGED